MEFLYWFIVVLALIFYFNHRQNKARKLMLMKKYNDEDIVENIMAETVWIGQTKEQLRDSLGTAADIDRKTQKREEKEIWKYNQKTKYIYSLKITLKNSEVIGWAKK